VIWSSIAITFILYFILLKGLKGSVLFIPDFQVWLSGNLAHFLLFSSLFWAVIFFLMIRFTRFDVLRIVVLAGTFALALAFAANDLVNFIGVPYAGLAAFQIGRSASDPFSISMERLADPTQVNSLMLIVASLIMIATLWISKKARSVTKTEIDLASHGKGNERFSKSQMAQFIVALGKTFAWFMKRIVPRYIRVLTRRRMKKPKKLDEKIETGLKPSFDLIRASVNLVVASSLISLGTLLRLPLSTTYVTFMVAMGTALADGAWGKETAVQRVNGVLTVIGGWFITALLAFSGAALLATLIYFFNFFFVILIIAISIFFIYRMHLQYRKVSARFNSEENEANKV
jgi:hypothetical protein